MYDRIFKALGDTFGNILFERTLKGYSDEDTAVYFGVRWAYLFHGMTYEDWREMIRIFRAKEEAGD